MARKKKKEVWLNECPHCDNFDAETWDLVQAHITDVHATVYEKASRGDYTTKMPYVTNKKDPEACDAYHLDQMRLNGLFRHDLEVEHNVVDNPKKEKLFEIAWEQGHSYGFSEVAIHYETLVELVK